jgi:hypothetical protein
MRWLYRFQGAWKRTKWSVAAVGTGRVARQEKRRRRRRESPIGERERGGGGVARGVWLRWLLLPLAPMYLLM